jgi:copper binding plastocyanin/azurin family protein
MKKISSMVVIAMLSAFIACGGGGGDGGIISPPPPPPPPPTCPDNTFCMRAASFSPTTLTVAKGTTVGYQNNSGVEHNVVFDSQASGAADVGDITSGTVSRTFNTSGTFAFHCTIHAGMSGSITVQ